MAFKHFTIAALACLTVLGVSSANADMKDFIFDAVGFQQRSYTYDMTPVNISLGGKVALRIPKAYLPKKEQWKDGKHDVVNIEAVLPDLKPRMYLKDTDDASTSETRNASRKKNFKDAERHSVIIHMELSASSKRAMQSPWANLFAEFHHYLSPSETGLPKISDIVFYDHHRDIAKSSGFILSYSNTYLDRIGNERFFYMSCENRLSHICKRVTNIGEDLIVKYSGGLKLNEGHQNWHEIDEKVSRFIKSLFVAPVNMPSFSNTPFKPVPSGGMSCKFGSGPYASYAKKCLTEAELKKLDRRNFLRDFSKAHNETHRSEYYRHFLGAYYFYGHGVSQDYKEAYFWLSLAEREKSIPPSGILISSQDVLKNLTESDTNMVHQRLQDWRSMKDIDMALLHSFPAGTKREQFEQFLLFQRPPKGAWSDELKKVWPSLKGFAALRPAEMEVEQFKNQRVTEREAKGTQVYEKTSDGFLETCKTHHIEAYYDSSDKLTEPPKYKFPCLETPLP